MKEEAPAKEEEKKSEEKDKKEEEKKPDQVVVSYQVDGVEVARNYVAKGSTPGVPGAPEKEGYNFIGWYYWVNGGNVRFESYTPVYFDTVVYAMFEKAAPAAEEAEEELEEIEDYETPLAAPAMEAEEDLIEVDESEILPEDIEEFVVVEDGEVPLPMPEEVETEEAAEEAKNGAAPKSVAIFASETEVNVGDTVVLSSVLEGFDGLDVSYTWKVDRGSGFEPIAGANGSSYSFEVTEENIAWGYTLTVSYC